MPEILGAGIEHLAATYDHCGGHILERATAEMPQGAKIQIFYMFLRPQEVHTGFS